MPHRPPTGSAATPRPRLPELLRVLAPLAGALLTCADAARAQSTPAAARVDSVFLARDLDGDGKTDYVVAESKPGSDADDRPARVAIYLGVRPGTAAPAWATSWDEELGADIVLAKTVPLDSGATFVELRGADGDYEATWLVLVQRGAAREQFAHGVDYGEGFFDVLRDGSDVVVEATQPHLEAAHRAVGRAIACPSSQWPVVRLVYDRARARFVAGATRCTPPTSVREP